MTVNFHDPGRADLLSTDDPPRPSLAILGLSLVPALVVVTLRAIGLL